MDARVYPHDVDKIRALLLSVACEHNPDDDSSDHRWRQCRTCLALEELDNRAIRVLLSSFVEWVDAHATV
jgi:hypothetical protein